MKHTLRNFLFSVILPISLGFFCVLILPSPASAQNSHLLARDRSQDGLGYSRNWSGYAITGDEFTEVHASWVVPDVKYGGDRSREERLSGDGTWVGIGGITSDDLIQVGTLAFANNSGDVYYRGFYEILPDLAVSIPMIITPGDSMSASLEEVKENEWLITLINTTTGSIFDKKIFYQSSNSSAEWIEERPLQASNRELLPFNDFEKVDFSDAGAVKNRRLVDLSAQGVKPITMLSGRDVLVIPTPISENSKEFSVINNPLKTLANTNQSEQSYSYYIPEQKIYYVIRIHY